MVDETVSGGGLSGGRAGLVSPAPGGQPGTAEAVRACVRRLFRKSEADVVTQAFFEMVLQHRLEKLK